MYSCNKRFIKCSRLLVGVVGVIYRVLFYFCVKIWKFMVGVLGSVGC